MHDRTAAHARPRLIAVLDADPELASALSEEQEAVAHGVLRAPELVQPAGPWTVPVPRSNDTLGLLVVEGIASGSTVVENRRSRELLGPGDVLRPWLGPDAGHLRTYNRWRVHTPLRMLLLDRRFALTSARWPEVTAALMDRLVLRARRLCFQRAANSLPRTTERLLLLLWHFAERWGRVTPAGVRLELPLTHTALAELVDTHRPTVTTALGELRALGRVTTVGEGGWLLCLPAPSSFAELREQVGLPSATPSPGRRFARRPADAELTPAG